MSAADPDDLPVHYVVYYQYSSGHPQMIASYRSREKAVDCLLGQRIPEGHTHDDTPKTRQQILAVLDESVGVSIDYRNVYGHGYYTLHVDQVNHDDSP